LGKEYRSLSSSLCNFLHSPNRNSLLYIISIDHYLDTTATNCKPTVALYWILTVYTFMQ
jgi:hypothetical protein